jgi:cellobiose dehydrogenase (acceptor)
MPIPEKKTYDYIIVGAGAAGIPLADKFTEAGKSVLVLEKGPPSISHWGGDLKPDFLANSTLAQFDVPGLAGMFYRNLTGYGCEDTVQPLGCLLGGQTAVGPGLWLKPNPRDWEQFPSGWSAKDVGAATTRAFQRVPGNKVPSKDGKVYAQEAYDIVGSGLKASGWKEVDANDEPAEKHKAYSRGAFAIAEGQRGGPLVSYLATAAQRKQLTVWMNSPVKRVVRQGGHITGVELECAGGYEGVINVTPGTGRVILSAGTFGSAKILLRSKQNPPFEQWR